MGRPSKYSKEFRNEAVELALTTNRTHNEIAQSLGINKNTLGNWIKKAKTTAEETKNPRSLNEDERDELGRLRKEVRSLRQDRDILRKAAAYFAKETIR